MKGCDSLIREKLKNVRYKKEIIAIIVLVIFATVIITLRGTHAYYNYEMAPVPIFTGRVGNFSGKGDTSNLDKPTDVNLMFYVQDITNPKNYTIMDGPPVLVSGYIISDKKSNCIPVNGTYDKIDDKVYSISEDGTVTVKISQSKPNQVVCRIYYDYEKDLTKEDIIVFALKEDDLGMIIYNDKHYIMSETIPSTGFTYNGSNCSNTEIATEINYNTTNGFTFKTEGPNLCYAYFNKTN